MATKEKEITTQTLPLHTPQLNEETATEITNVLTDALYHFKYKGTSADIRDAARIVLAEKVAPNLHRHDPNKGTLKTWLYRIARNWKIDEYRKNRNKPVEYISFVGPTNRDDDILTEEQITLREVEQQSPAELQNLFDKKLILNTIKKSIKRLAPGYRKLIRLRFFEEYTYEEIAVRVDKPLGTVKAQLFRAKALLHDVLSQQKVILETRYLSEEQLQTRTQILAKKRNTKFSKKKKTITLPQKGPSPKIPSMASARIRKVA
jgi:RNA polymerase sigma-70 factor (ECF subfamily)